MRYSAVVRGGLHAEYGGAIGSIGNNIVDSKTRRIAQELDNKGEYELRALINTLLGAAPGVTATHIHYEIAASDELGGARPVVGITDINRPTLSSDVTDIQ